MKGTITVNDPKRNKSIAFKNNAPLINYISEINGIQIDNAEDLVMPMYNLFEYNKNYRETTSTLWSYYRDEPSNPLSSDSESFKYKTSITGNSYNVNATITGDIDMMLINFQSWLWCRKIGKNETEIVVPLKHLSNFWGTFNIPWLIVK